jgi:hypothetical protein
LFLVAVPFLSILGLNNSRGVHISSTAPVISAKKKVQKTLNASQKKAKDEYCTRKPNNFKLNRKYPSDEKNGRY